MAPTESPISFIYEILQQILLHCITPEDERNTTTSHLDARYQQTSKLRDPGSGIAFLLVSGCRVNKFWNETINTSSPLQQAMFLKPDFVSAGLRLNPLIGRVARDISSVQEDDKAQQTWHKMLVVQTSESQVALQSKYFSGGGYFTTFDVSFAGSVRMDVFATWIAGPGFSVYCQKMEGHESPVLTLEFGNCMKRGIGEVSYKSTPGAGGR